jgi:hypothetical protein
VVGLRPGVLHCGIELDLGDEYLARERLQFPLRGDQLPVADNGSSLSTLREWVPRMLVSVPFMPPFSNPPLTKLGPNQRSRRSNP